MNAAAMEDRLKELYAKDFRLLSIHFDALYKCDLDCCHCYLDDKRTDPLSTTELITHMRAARELGALKLTFSGGELFLRRDLIEILEEARRLGFYIKLKTHGGLVTEDKAAALARIGIGRVDISVYALEASVHDYITRRKGSLARTLRGIDRLQAHGIVVQVNSSVMQANKEHYPALVKQFAKRGIHVSLDGSIRGTNSGTLETYALALSMDERVQMEAFRRRVTGGAPKPIDMGDDDHICWAGKTSIHVQPDGTVTPCVAWPMPLGNVRETPLHEIWNHSPMLAEIRAAKRKDREGCSSCSFERKCIFCPGKAYVENQGAWLRAFDLQCGDTAGRVLGTLQYNAELLREERPRKVHFPIAPSGQPSAEPSAAPSASIASRVPLPARAVELAARNQKGPPRKRVFNILSASDWATASQSGGCP
jgi:radical SAM protein with 4Fe4S-binding SPASM domain